MLQLCWKYPLISLAFTVCAAQASDGGAAYLAAGGAAVRSGSGDCWRTGAWTPENAVRECDAHPITYWAEVRFDFERDELGADARKVLDDLAQKLLAAEPERVAVAAYADRIGDPAYNARLSARRAQAIRAYLVEKGVPEKLMRAESRGSRDPVAQCSEMGPENRQNTKLIACLQPDRRVEIEARALKR